MHNRHREGGQVLVLIILAIVGLFGFAALAVDGGRVFAERRRAQNAADAAAMAAAFAGATWKDYEVAGITSTTANGYNDADPTDVTTFVDENVEVHNPPVRGRYSVASETIVPTEYYQVIIRKKVPQVLSQIVYSGDLWVEVEAVAHGTAQRGFPYGAAIVAMCPNCCDGLLFSGDSQSIVKDGNIISNSNWADDPDNAGCHSVSRSGNGSVVLDNGSLIATGMIYNGGEVTATGDPDVDALICKKEVLDEDGKKIFVDVSCFEIMCSEVTIDPDTGEEIRVEVDCATVAEPGQVLWDTPNPDTYDYPFEPSCENLDGTALDVINPAKGDVGADGIYKDSATLQPGIYPNGITVTNTNVVLTLQPGMYCLDADLAITGGSLIGSDIMITMREESSVKIQTNQEISLQAPTEEDSCIPDPDLSPDCWTGFLFYMPDENPGTITLNGGGSATFSGTIYAPGPPEKDSDYKCTLIGGSEENAYNASIICYTINITGTNGLNIKYDEAYNAQSPGSLELAE